MRELSVYRYPGSRLCYNQCIMYAVRWICTCTTRLCTLVRKFLAVSIYARKDQAAQSSFIAFFCLLMRVGVVW
jgi:hypothetical protein